MVSDRLLSPGHFSASVFATFLVLAACGPEGGDAEITPLAAQQATVNETLIVALRATGGGGATFVVTAPAGLGAFDSTARTSGTAEAGGEFRWLPVASHVGTHELTVELRSGGDVIASTPLVVEVSPGSAAAPIFLRPGAGRSYDLQRDPCVRFDIEVRDDDSESVTISARGELPEGGDLTQRGPKSADFEWCPRASQAAAKERWTIRLVADDGANRREHDFIAVLRGSGRRDCGGQPPVVNVVSPSNGAMVSNNGGFEVLAEVTDDVGLRDAPILFYTESAPDDPANPDVTTFEQVIMRPRSGQWVGRVPVPSSGQDTVFYAVVSATDNDDPTGAICDNRTDSEVVNFTGVVQGGGSGLAACEPCRSSVECESGTCVVEGPVSLCAERCSGGTACTGGGTCGTSVTTEGSTIAACGSLSQVCGVGGSCTDDANEVNNSRGAATPLESTQSGTICSGDPDYFVFNAGADERLTVTVSGFDSASGDIDVELQNSTGRIVDVSAGSNNSESVSFCFANASRGYVHVYGYDGAENDYNVMLSRQTGQDCCENDRFEPNDSQQTATPLPNGLSEIGVICGRESDYWSFTLMEPQNVEVELLVQEGDADLDFNVYSPSGAFLASANGSGSLDSAMFRANDAGRYTIEVYAYEQARSAEYLLAVNLSTASGCASSSECSIGDVCNAGQCVDRRCQSSFACPQNHTCTSGGPNAMGYCGAGCTRNADCRSGERCKWMPEGRFCVPAGSGALNSACTDVSECGGQRACVPWRVGTCTRMGCARNSDCESETFCVSDQTPGLPPNTTVCAYDCDISAFRCRSGQECLPRMGTDGQEHYVCVTR